jgi:hypothetical protein
VIDRSRPVAGAAGDLLPGLVVDLVSVLLDRKILAAHRAAKYHVASTDAEFDFLLANRALHKNKITPEKLLTSDEQMNTDDMLPPMNDSGFLLSQE